jgi:hypothetical protein
MTRYPTTGYTHIPLLITCLSTSKDTPMSSTHHPLTHDWAHHYALYSSPVNLRLGHPYPLYSSPVGQLMEISSYSWIVHLKSDWSRDVSIKGVVWIGYRIFIINKNIVFYYFVFCDVPTNREIWVTHWANIINAIDPTMMSEEYPIMMIRWF